MIRIKLLKPAWMKFT